MDSYKDQIDIKTRKSILENDSQSDLTELWKACINLREKMSQERRSTFEISSAVTNLNIFIQDLEPDQYESFNSFEIPQILISLFSLDFPMNVNRVVTHCIVSLYRKALSTQVMFESEEFIKSLINNDPITPLTDYKIFILAVILNNTKNNELCKNVFSFFPLDDISTIASSSSNDNTICNLFSIIKKLSENIAQENDAKAVVAIIHKNIKRGRKDSVKIMIETLCDFVLRNILPLDSFNEFSLGETIAGLLKEPVCQIDVEAAKFLTIFMNKYQAGYPVDLSIAINKIQKDSKNEESASIFAKFLMECVIVNGGISLELFNNGCLLDFFNNIDSYSITIKPYIMVICLRCIFTANVENIQLLLTKIDKSALIRPIELGLENGSDLVVIPTLCAISTLIKNMGSDQSYDDIIDELFAENISIDDIGQYTMADNDNICSLANSVLELDFFKKD